MRSLSSRTPAGMPVTMIVSWGPCDSPAEVKVKRMSGFPVYPEALRPQDKLPTHVSHPAENRLVRDHHLRPDDVPRLRRGGVGAVAAIPPLRPVRRCGVVD